MIFRHFTVDGAAGAGKDQLSHASCDARVQQVEPAEDVDLCVQVWFAHAHCDARLRGLVTDDVGLEISDDSSHLIATAQVELEQRHPGRHVLASAGAQIVEHSDRVAFSARACHDMAADEAGTAADQNSHRQLI